MKLTLTLPVSIEVHEGTPNKVLPSFYESAGKVQTEQGEEFTIGSSLVNPFVFYLFAGKDGTNGPNGSFLATVNFHNTFNDIVHEFKTGRMAIAEPVVETT